MNAVAFAGEGETVVVSGSFFCLHFPLWALEEMLRGAGKGKRVLADEGVDL